MTHDGTPPPRTLVSRITTILLAFRSGQPQTLTEIARHTGLPMSTVHRIAAELSSWQLLRRTGDGRYEVGPNMRQLAGDAIHLHGLADRAPLVVSDLCEVTRRRARLGVLCDDTVAYVEKRVPAEPATTFRAAATLPAHATALGKALLAFAPPATVAAVQRRLTPHTPRTLVTAEQLQRDLVFVRRTGFARSRGELVPGDCAVAAPVFGPGGTVIAALELQVDDLSSEVQEFRGVLMVAARGLSRELSLQGDGRCATHDRPPLRLLRGRPDEIVAGDRPARRSGAAVLP